MKILVLSSHTPSLFWFRMDMMKSFVALGHEVVAVGNEPIEQWQSRFADTGISYRNISVQRTGTNFLRDLKTLKQLRRLIKDEKPDKIFSYQAKTVIYGGIAARLAKVEAYPLIAGVGSVFLSKGLKASIVRTILKCEYRFALKKAQRVFFQNGDDVQTFVRNKLVKKEQVAMMNGSGVNLERFTVQPLPKSPCFLSISRLIRDKGVIEYLEAARFVKSKYPQARFLLVGPFDSNPSAITEDELRPYIENGTVEYFGEQADVVPYLAQCSVYVLPSYREGTPKTVLEAMACFKAIITTDAPGCRETVENGKNGYLVPVKDVASLADKMIELIENPERIREMAACGRQMVEEKFDVQKVNEQVIKVMQL